MYFIVITKGCRTKLIFVAAFFAARDASSSSSLTFPCSWASAHEKMPRTAVTTSEKMADTKSRRQRSDPAAQFHDVVGNGRVRGANSDW
jgi:hypothetical protein